MAIVAPLTWWSKLIYIYIYCDVLAAIETNRVFLSFNVINVCTTDPSENSNNVATCWTTWKGIAYSDQLIINLYSCVIAMVIIFARLWLDEKCELCVVVVAGFHVCGLLQAACSKCLCKFMPGRIRVWTDLTLDWLLYLSHSNQWSHIYALKGMFYCMSLIFDVFIDRTGHWL